MVIYIPQETVIFTHTVKDDLLWYNQPENHRKRTQGKKNGITLRVMIFAAGDYFSEYAKNVWTSVLLCPNYQTARCCVHERRQENDTLRTTWI